MVGPRNPRYYHKLRKDVDVKGYGELGPKTVRIENYDSLFGHLLGAGPCYPVAESR